MENCCYEDCTAPAAWTIVAADHPDTFSCDGHVGAMLVADVVNHCYPLPAAK